MDTPHPLPWNSAPAYTVKLELFEGPMDLLLRLIEKQKLDITRVSLAAITDQYLMHLHLVEEIRPDAIADFLVVAARLLLIKSRVLLPKPPVLQGEEEEEDPGDQLARQLIEYKRFKEIAQLLRQKTEAGLRAYPRLAPPPKIQSRITLEGLSVADLANVLREVLQSQPASEPVNHVMTPITIRIEDSIEHILRLTQRRRQFSFRHLLASSTSRMEIIVSFLAILELVKRRRIRVHQERLFGTILISATESSPPPHEES